MLTKDELEAVGRLRCEAYAGPEMYEQPLLRAMDARRMYAAVLREHPPGDELPFAVEWFREAAYEWLCNRRKDRESLDWLQETTGSVGKIRVVAGGRVSVAEIPEGSTRGDVRRFLAWQGIVLEAGRAEKV